MKQLDYDYLKGLHKKLSELQVAATTYGTYQSHELLDVVDHLARVAGFLVDLRLQEIEHGEIVAYNPTNYLDGKLEIAYLGIMSYRDKTAKV